MGSQSSSLQAGFLAAVLAAQASCTPAVGDSAFRVQGVVQDQSGAPLQGCTMKVRFEGDSVAAYEKKIDGNFRNTFTVAPGPHAFRLIVACADTLVPYESGTFQIQGIERYEKPIDLGIIVLQERKG